MDKLLCEKEVAVMLGLGVNTIRLWRKSRKHLAFVKLGASVRYKESEIDNFVKQCEHKVEEYGQS